MQASPSSDDLRADAARNRERVLEVARELLEAGDETLPMNLIARRAGVGVGTVYRHFPTKEALVTELGRQKMRHRIAELDQALAADDPWDGLVAVMSHAAEAMANDAGLREVFGSSRTSGWCPGATSSCRTAAVGAPGGSGCSPERPPSPWSPAAPRC